MMTKKKQFPNSGFVERLHFVRLGAIIIICVFGYSFVLTARRRDRKTQNRKTGIAYEYSERSTHEHFIRSIIIIII